MERSVIGGVLGGGGQELREAVSDVLLKSLLLQNCRIFYQKWCTLFSYLPKWAKAEKITRMDNSWSKLSMV